MSRPSPGLARPLIAGFAGSIALTALHQAARRSIPDAPRMDVLGRRALAKGLDAAGVEPPKGDDLQEAALAGDILANGLMYAAAVGVGGPGGAYLRGGLVGLVAGIGAIALAPELDLGVNTRKWPARTKLMTAAWYTFGGLVAAECYRRLSPPAS